MWKNTEVDFQNGLKGYFNLAGQFLGFRLPFGAVTTKLAQPLGAPANLGVESTWAARPSAGDYDGQILLINDPLISPNVVIAHWNVTNTSWLLEPHLFPIINTTTAIVVDNVLTETDIASYTAQAGVMGFRGQIELMSWLEISGTTTSVSGTVKQYSNGTLSGTLTGVMNVPGTSYEAHTRVINQNNVASQRIYKSVTSAASGNSGTTARNTNSLTLAIKHTFTWGATGTGTGTLNCLHAYAWVVPSL